MCRRTEVSVFHFRCRFPFKSLLSVSLIFCRVQKNFLLKLWITSLSGSIPQFSPLIQHAESLNNHVRNAERLFCYQIVKFNSLRSGYKSQDDLTQIKWGSGDRTSQY